MGGDADKRLLAKELTRALGVPDAISGQQIDHLVSEFMRRPALAISRKQSAALLHSVLGKEAITEEDCLAAFDRMRPSLMHVANRRRAY